MIGWNYVFRIIENIILTKWKNKKGIGGKTEVVEMMRKEKVAIIEVMEEDDDLEERK